VAYRPQLLHETCLVLKPRACDLSNYCSACCVTHSHSTRRSFIIYRQQVYFTSAKTTCSDLGQVAPTNQQQAARNVVG